MKNKNENLNNNENEEIKILPESFDTESVDTCEGSVDGSTEETRFFPYRWGKILAFIALCQIAAMIFLFAFFMQPRMETEQETVFEESETEEVEESIPEENWRGVFDSEETYLSCLRTVVLIEGGNGKLLQSGFVYSSDGYIATVFQAGTIPDGRIYITVGEGEKYKVESIVRDGESGISLLKISAEGLRAVEFYGKEESLLPGEALVALGSYSTSEQRIRIGEASGIREAMLDVDISLGISPEGTPLFDSKGRLAAVACVQGEEKSEYVTAAILSSDFEKKLEQMKNDNF